MKQELGAKAALLPLAGSSLFLERAVAVSPEPALQGHHIPVILPRGHGSSSASSTLLVQHILQGDPGGQNQQNNLANIKAQLKFLWSRNTSRAS